jgi:predicted Zn finger-like uncharacterized protein
MLIICPNCTTSYQVDRSSLGPAGRSVRCVRCRNVWFAANTEAKSGIAAAHRAQIAQIPATASASEAPGAEPGPSHGSAQNDTPPLAEAGLAAPDNPPADPSPASEGPLVQSPPLAPIETGSAASVPSEGEDIETVAARRAKAQAKRRRKRFELPGLPTAIAALALLDVGLIGWRADMVRWAPQTAPLYAAIGLPVNVRGLVFTDVTVEAQTRDGVQALLVRGTVASTATRSVEVPRLRFAARNESGNEIYTWTALPNRRPLAPGDTLAFQSRFAAPAPETRDVLVRFFNRRDLRADIE